MLFLDVRSCVRYFIEMCELFESSRMESSEIRIRIFTYIKNLSMIFHLIVSVTATLNYILLVLYLKVCIFILNRIYIIIHYFPTLLIVFPRNYLIM